MGRSFGAMIATNLANTALGKSLFKGLMCIAPCYGLVNDEIKPYVEKGILQIANYFVSNYIFRTLDD